MHVLLVQVRTSMFCTYSLQVLPQHQLPVTLNSPFDTAWPCTVGTPLRSAQCPVRAVTLTSSNPLSLDIGHVDQLPVWYMKCNRGQLFMRRRSFWLPGLGDNKAVTCMEYHGGIDRQYSRMCCVAVIRSHSCAVQVRREWKQLHGARVLISIGSSLGIFGVPLLKIR